MHVPLCVLHVSYYTVLFYIYISRVSVNIECVIWVISISNIDLGYKRCRTISNVLFGSEYEIQLTGESVSNGPFSSLYLLYWHLCGKYLIFTGCPVYYSFQISLLAAIFLSSAGNLCKQFGPWSEPTESRLWSGSKMFESLTVIFLKKLIAKKSRFKIIRF